MAVEGSLSCTFAKEATQEKPNQRNPHLCEESCQDPHQATRKMDDTEGLHWRKNVSSRAHLPGLSGDPA